MQFCSRLFIFVFLFFLTLVVNFLDFFKNKELPKWKNWLNGSRFCFLGSLANGVSQVFESKLKGQLYFMICRSQFGLVTLKFRSLCHFMLLSISPFALRAYRVQFSSVLQAQQRVFYMRISVLWCHKGFW